MNKQCTSQCIKYYEFVLLIHCSIKCYYPQSIVSNSIKIEDKYQVEYDTIDDNTRHQCQNQKSAYVGLFC